MLEKGSYEDFDVCSTYGITQPPQNKRRSRKMRATLPWPIGKIGLTQELQDSFNRESTNFFQGKTDDWSHGGVLFDTKDRTLRYALANAGTRNGFGSVLLINECDTYNRQRRVAKFEFKADKDGIWNIDHRDVSEDYRNRGVFSAVNNTILSAAQIRANEMKQEQRIRFNVGQPMLVARLMKMGYKPIPQDVQRVDKMLSGDAELMCDFLYRNQDELNEEKLYCFERSKITKPDDRKQNNAFRVTLEQVVRQDAKHVPIVTSAVRGDCHEILSSPTVTV